MRRLARVAASVSLFAAVARADTNEPPWDSARVPLPENIESVVAKRDDERVLAAPSADAPARGSLEEGAHLPIYAVREGAGCEGRWLMIGPLAWICQTKVDMTDEPPLPAFERPKETDSGLPFPYFFVGRNGSAGYARLEMADDAEPDEDLQPGFGLAIVDQKAKGNSAYGRTHHGLWVPMRDLIPVRAFAFHGEEIRGPLDVAWALDDKAPVFEKPVLGAKMVTKLARLEVVHVAETSGAFLRIGDGRWVRAKDVRRPTIAPRPKEALPGERWIDVDLAQQTLVAYEGETPVFATLVSTGRGAQGSDYATPKGVHRIWVKLRSSTMGNLDDESASSTYEIEDVPYVQFFSKGVALHGAFWHQKFGHAHSHGCVNLAPKDAQRLFSWTLPRVPAGWSAALPTEFEPGTLVRVR